MLQGDTLSPYLFAPISDILNWRTEPYRTNEIKISHTFYTDDLKIYSPDGFILRNMIKIIVDMAKQFGLQMNKKKCAQLHISNDKIYDKANPSDIKEVSVTEPYRYLGLEQVDLTATYLVNSWAGFRMRHHCESIESVMKSKTVLLLCYVIETLKAISHNRPDIILYDKEKKVIYVLEIAVTWALTGKGLPTMEERKLNKHGVNSNLSENHPTPYPAGDNLKNQLNERYKCRVKDASSNESRRAWET